MYEDQQRRRRQPEHDKFSSPDFKRQQQQQHQQLRQQRSDNFADELPSRLRGRVKWDDDDASADDDRRPAPHDSQQDREHQRRPSSHRGDDSLRRSDSQDNIAAARQQGDEQGNASSGGGGSNSGARARIEFNLDKLQAPADAANIKPRPSSKYSKDLGPLDPPVLKRLSGMPSDRLGPDDGEPSGADRAPADSGPERLQQKRRRSESSSQAPLSPDRGPGGRDRDRERDRDRDRDRNQDRDRERDPQRQRDNSQRRPTPAERDRDRDRDRPAPRSSDPPRDRSRPGRERADRSRERSRDRAGQASRERGGREHPAARDPAGRDSSRGQPPPRDVPPRDAGARAPSRDGSRQRGGTSHGDRDGGDDGFARPQPRGPPPPPRHHQQKQPPPPRGRPMRPPAHDFKFDDAEKADALLAGVRARHAGLVEQQLRHLILTKALTQEDVWEKACQAAKIPPELVDGPLVAMARRSDCTHALMSRASAHMMPPLDPDVPTTLAAVGEDVYIQQLQAVINRFEQQSKAPYCAEVWALKGASQAAARQDAGQEEGVEGVSYSLLLPAELKGLLWDG